MAKFTQYPIDDLILEGLAKAGFSEPNTVQQLVLTPALKKRDIFVAAPTGSGKTLAFLIPVIQHCLDNDSDTFLKTIILAPTRELVEQIDNVFRRLTEHSHLKSVRISRATRLSSLNKLLAERPHVLIATPGRLLTLMAEETIDISPVKQIVLDEADRLFDIGNREEVQGILALMNQKRQLIMCSATLSDDRVMHFADTWLEKPEYVELAAPRQLPDNLDVRILRADDRDHKLALTVHLLKRNGGKKLIFVANKSMADALARNLRQSNIQTLSLHADQDIPERKKRLLDFRNGAIAVLVATDVASRGLDIDNVDIVIQWDIPKQGDTFLHRSGRAGRAGKPGRVITLYENHDRGLLGKIERYLGASIQAMTIEGLEPKTKEHLNKKPGKRKKTEDKKVAPKVKKRLRDQKNKGKPKWAGKGPKNPDKNNIWGKKPSNP